MGLITRLCLLLILLTGCATTPIVSETWTPGTFLADTGQPLTDAAVTSLIRNADFILVGESHTNPCDHAVQARIIENLAQAGVRFSLGLEMLPVTAQPVLDAFNARRITAEEFGQAVGWQSHWGYSYDQYKPLFLLAEKYDLPVVGLNIPRETMTRFRDNKSLSPTEKAFLPRRIIEPSAPQKQVLDEEFRLHAAMRAAQTTNATMIMPPATVDLDPAQADMARKFSLVQSLWDSMMAEQATVWRTRLDRPMLILTGAGHVEHGWGIEYRLRTVDPTARCLAVLPVRSASDFEDQTDVTQRALPGKMIWFYCAAEHKSRLGMNILFEPGQIRIASVESGSKAQKAGLMADDILTAAGDQALNTATDLHFAAMTAVRRKKPLILTVRRGEKTLHVTVPLP